MPKFYRFYMDDSGSPNPDHSPNDSASKVPDFFALGGILIDESHVDAAKVLIKNFREKWPQLNGVPLHSYEIRNSTQGFRWVASLSDVEKARFFSDLNQLMLDIPYFAHASVIDRAGYNERYAEMYGADRWMMCKTAFCIAVERAAKFARHQDAKLRVYVERSTKKQEEILRSYYDEMRSKGLPFCGDGSKGYSPMTPDDLAETLYEFQFKPKQSELMQIADLALWPVCQGGYNPNHRSFEALRAHGKLLDAACQPGCDLFGIKYSCFKEVA